jgi:pilus assembly protein CpaE
MAQSVQLPDWQRNRTRYRVTAFLSQGELASFESVAGESDGVELATSLLDPGLPIPAGLLASVDAVMVEVRCDQSAAAERLHKLVGAASGVPVIAAVRDPSLADLRKLMRSGIWDVLPLPLASSELRQVMERLTAELDQRGGKPGKRGSIVTAIKSRGGVGATTLLTQLACLSAMQTPADGETCLIDMDLQHGNAALYLGQLPKLSLKDLLDAGKRLDSELLHATLSRHACGLHYVGAPQEVLPLDSLSPDDALAILDVVAREFRTIFVDLPHDMTDWSFHVLGQSSAILLVSELSISSLHQTKRQLEFLRENDLAEIPVHVVMNKVSKRLFKAVSFADAERIIGRDVAFSIADDAATVRSALDQGEIIAHIDRRSRTAKDLDHLATSLRPALAVAK